MTSLVCELTSRILPPILVGARKEKVVGVIVQTEGPPLPLWAMCSSYPGYSTENALLVEPHFKPIQDILFCRFKLDLGLLIME